MVEDIDGDSKDEIIFSNMGEEGTVEIKSGYWWDWYGTYED